MYRKLWIVALLLVICCNLCACTYEYQSFDKKSEYHEIWTINFTEAQNCGCYGDETVSLLFPAEIEDLDVEKYYGEYRQAAFDDEYQIFLTVHYDSEVEFSEELSRIEELTEMKETKYFDLPAAVTIFGWNHCYEYALIDTEKQTVHYVYLEYMNSEDIAFKSKYLPEGFDELERFDVTGTDTINVYYALTESEKHRIAKLH